MNNVKKDKRTNVTIHTSFCLFSFSVCVLSSVLKILVTVNTHLMNTKKINKKTGAI
jgi:hypothetical protein